MCCSRGRLVAFSIVLGLTLCAGYSAAQEHIVSFHSDIQIALDGSMLVTESITVRAEGVNIRRGIFRDFPTDYRDPLGNRYNVAFDVIGITRDDRSEPWRSERRGNGARVYIGDENVLLEPGEHRYLIRYRTDRQLGYFDDHDELYWNVTGNGWDFPILRASASVSLPAAIAADELSLTAYTGFAGSGAQNYEGSLDTSSAEFITTQSLAPGEGLTIAVSWPKGVTLEPGPIERAGFLLFDNRGLLLMCLALLLSCAYLYKSWSLVGRDPMAGIIIPHYEPPKGYSPASTRYITKMGYDRKAFSAAIINLAVKGHVLISKDAEGYTLQKNESAVELAPGEQILLAYLFSKKNSLVLDITNHSILGTARKEHEKALKKDYSKIYFNLNSALLLPSLLGSLTVLIVVAIIGAMTPMVLALSAVIALIHGVFFYLLRAPSVKGRMLMDKLEGFKQYLEVAEQDDLTLRNPPDKTPELFEEYLPFALALGVEQAWAEQFTDVFAALEQEQGYSYHPVWYVGAFHGNDLSAFSRDIGTGFDSAISTASTAPGSTSGAGGFSGGGGGGGGGGGW